MNLADLFTAINSAGIRLVNNNGQLQLRGPEGSIRPELATAAAEHKPTLLALLPPLPSPEQEDQETKEEREAIQQADGVEEEFLRQQVARHDYSDWRSELLFELGLLTLRIQQCRDPIALTVLRKLQATKPTNLDEWLALGKRIRDTEIDLRRRWRLPPSIPLEPGKVFTYSSTPEEERIIAALPLPAELWRDQKMV